VVTAIEFALFPVSEVHAGALFFPLERAREVLNAWAGWTGTAPAEITSIGRLIRFPAIPDLPPQLSGRSYTVVEAATTLDPVAADELLAPLRMLGPSNDTFAAIPVEQLDQLNMDPPAPTPVYGDGWLQTDLSTEAVEAIVQAAGPGVDTPLLAVDLRHIGAALTPGRGGGAVDGLPGAFLGFAIGITPRPEAIPPVQAAVTAVQDALAPWRAEGRYLNFAEQPGDASSFYDPLTWARLRAVKAAYDPDNLIQSNHPIPAAQA
jgi:hypothetical protein